MRELLQTIYDALSASSRRPSNTVATVPLRDWDNLDEATVWCDTQFKENGKQYLRRINSHFETALFEFGDEEHAVEFALRFG